MDNEINRGELARQVQENPIYAEAITATKAKIFDDWCNTKWFQVRKREKLWRMYRSAEAVESHIAKVITTGNMARKVQADKERLKSVI
ncbi:MAG: hypothetical protein ACN2B6_00780 [Rickettsiales bacterium]